MPATESEIVVPVEGMTCGGCASSVRRALERLDGVVRADVQLDAGQASVRYDAGAVAPADLARAIRAAGFLVPEGWPGR